MIPFLCHFMDEVVILSDGRVTTCCMDPMGENCFGSIYEDSFKTIEENLRDIRERVSRDVNALPRCRICYKKISASNFPDTGMYKINFSENERIEYLKKHSRIHKLVIETSSVCNLKSNGCMQSRFDIPAHRNAKLLDLEHTAVLLENHLDQIETIRLYNYGETFFNKQSIPFIHKIKFLSQDTRIAIATNGMLLNSESKQKSLVRSGADRLLFSIHGGSQQSVEPYMTSDFDFEKVVSILKNLVRFRNDIGLSTPLLQWKYLLFEWNDSDQEINKAIQTAEKIGMDGIQFTLPGYPAPSQKYKASPEKMTALSRNFPS